MTLEGFEARVFSTNTTTSTSPVPRQNVPGGAFDGAKPIRWIHRGVPGRRKGAVIHYHSSHHPTRSSIVENTAPCARVRRRTVGSTPPIRATGPIPALSSAPAFEGRYSRASHLARTSARTRASHVTRVFASTRARLRVDGVELEEISGVGDRRERARRRGVCGRESVRMRECARVEHRREMLDRARVGGGARWTRAGVRASSSDASARPRRGERV